MGEIPNLKPLSEADWLNEINLFRKETSIPGYWGNLEKNTDQWAIDVSGSPFWGSIKAEVAKWSNEYRTNNSGNLLAKPGLSNFIGKKESRIIGKLYNKRLNGENNDKLFDITGPPIPILNDLVRNRISCQFVDGVEFLSNKIVELAKKNDMEVKRSREGRIEGYFAQHINFYENVFYRFAGSVIPAKVICEIQIATELSTRIWEGTHAIYETARENKEDPDDWQWNPSDPRFISRQLGHMIHLADGLLVQLRESVKSIRRS